MWRFPFLQRRCPASEFTSSRSGLAVGTVFKCFPRNTTHALRRPGPERGAFQRSFGRHRARPPWWLMASVPDEKLADPLLGCRGTAPSASRAELQRWPVTSPWPLVSCPENGFFDAFSTFVSRDSYITLAQSTRLPKGLEEHIPALAHDASGWVTHRRSLKLTSAVLRSI